jgi:membrane-associated protein
METAAEWAFRFLDEHALLALFVWLLLEEAGLPMPVPGDLVILGAGTRLGAGQFPWLVAVLVIEAATLLGSTALFAIARWGGRPLLLRFGRYLRLDAARLARTETFLQRRGFRAVVVGRLTPGLRVATTVAAGAFGVPYRQFLPAALVGSNNLPFLALGYLAGPQLLQLLQGIGFSAHLVSVLASLALVIAGGGLLRRRAHLQAAPTTLDPALRLEVALWAGAVATAATVAVLNLGLYGLSILHGGDPGAALIALGRALIARLGIDSLAALVILGSLGYVVVYLLWAVGYSLLEPHLPRPDWRGGLIYILAPLAASQLLFLPALGAGPAGTGLGLGPAVLVEETFRHLVYGWALATSYTLLGRARQARRRAAGSRESTA